MMKKTASVEISNQAEGSPNLKGLHEPDVTTRTTTLPAIRLADEQRGPAAETGVVAMVVDSAEAKENHDSQDASRTPAETASIVSDKEAVSRNPAVLIIEDSTELAEIIEVTLQRLDMVTAHETHGTRAIKRFDELKPDVVLLDIGLPDMTGWKLLEDIKERKGSARMPAVVVITAYGDPANRLIGKLQNVHDYLIKPFTADEVERVVIGALSSVGK